MHESIHANQGRPMRLPIPFTKMSGSGNDFVVIDNRTGAVPPDDASTLARLVCRHRLSVGADGIVLIGTAPAGSGVDFSWRYINADGSDGEMCGNGAMCGARFAVVHGIAPASCRFLTPSGIVQATVAADADADPAVAITVEDPGPIRHDIAIDVAGQSMQLHGIEVGVPHAVAIVDDADAFVPGEALLTLGRAIRHHEVFAPAGVNVNIVSVLPDGALRMRTYERGVEAETLACGTGAIASALVATSLGLATPAVPVVVSSGRRLSVAFDWDGLHARNVVLQGEARLISRGEILPDALV